MGVASRYKARAMERYDYAKSIGDADLYLMLKKELQEREKELSGSFFKRLIGAFSGDSSDQLPFCGYEMKRVIQRLGKEAPDMYLDQELYFLPVEKLTELVNRFGLRLREEGLLPDDRL